MFFFELTNLKSLGFYK